MNRRVLSGKAALAVAAAGAAVVGCHDATKPDIPLAGRYQLVAVNGRSLPVGLTPNGCPASITGGSLALDSLGLFNCHIDWSGSCPPTPPSAGSWDCRGVMPSTRAPKMDLTGVSALPGLCTIRVTGFPPRAELRWTGVDSAVWGDPRFTFGQ